jgi:regulator of replication initiation timing
MNNNESKISELQAELRDAYETINALIESNDILQVDLQIILGFLKQNNIDLSYVVKKTDIVKPTKKKKKKSE